MTASAVASPILGSEQQRLGFLAIAACFVAVGGSVFVLAVDVLEATVVLSFTVAAATMLDAALATRMGVPWALALEFGAVAGFGATAVLLFLAFPVNRLRTRPGRWLAGASLALAVALVACYGWVIAADTGAYALLQPALFGVLSADLLAACGLATLACFSPATSRAQARRMLALLAVGAAGSLAPFYLLALVPKLLGFGYMVSPDVAILSLGLLPISLGGAVLTRQFLGIDRLVRRGLVALVVWLALLGAYTLGLEALRQATGLQHPVLTSALKGLLLEVAVVAGTFPFLQDRLRRLLERALFHDLYDYAETLQQLSVEVVGLRGIEAIATHVLARLGETLDLTWAAKVISQAPEEHVHDWGNCPNTEDLHALVAASGAPKQQGSSVPHSRRCCLFPLVADATPVGTLLVGPKDHDVELLMGDQALVATIAPLVATALQNDLLVCRLEQQVVTLGEREQALVALSGQLLHAHEEERRRIALDLHDDPLARLTLLGRELETIPEQPQAQRCREAAQKATIALRAICMDLRPFRP